MRGDTQGEIFACEFVRGVEGVNVHKQQHSDI